MIPFIIIAAIVTVISTSGPVEKVPETSHEIYVRELSKGSR